MTARASGGMGFLSTVTEGIAVALDAIRANKIQSGLTILGVTIGVLVVMVMAAVITGINESFSELIAPEGVTTFWVAHAELPSLQDVTDDEAEEELAFLRNPPLRREWAKDLQRIQGIRSVAPIVELGGYDASSGSDRVRTSLSGVGSDYLAISGGDLVHGRWFTQSEADRRATVAVIDSATAAGLFETRDPLGRDIRISRGSENARVRVIGIYRAPANLFAGFASHYVWMPFVTADKVLRVRDRDFRFVVQPDPETELRTALDAIRDRMRQLRRLKPGEEDNFAIITADQVMALWGQLTGVLFAAMMGLSSIGLMVGGVGVIGIMMISVTERTREIGLRKAMGGRRRDIMWQFLVEAATLTFLGGATGMLLGGGLVWVVNQSTPLIAVVPLWSIVAALAASVLTGIGFGLYPASRAAGLDPIDALRYE
ncbi:ABC transporter permease [Candidatus Palauibacter sp.]|uniref:ABC transporter permease n=1 Tax=Candidatus Palauibacter sp. TaxID=3101350 RepID=UPI003B52C2CF